MSEHHEPDKLAIIGDPAEGWAAVGDIVVIILWEFGDWETSRSKGHFTWRNMLEFWLSLQRKRNQVTDRNLLKASY